MRKNLLQLFLENAREPIRHGTKFIAQDEDGTICHHLSYNGLNNVTNAHMGFITRVEGYTGVLATDWKTPLEITPAFRKIIGMYLDKSQGWQINYDGTTIYNCVDVVYRDGEQCNGITLQSSETLNFTSGEDESVIYRKHKQSTSSPEEDRAFDQLNEKLNSGEKPMIINRKELEKLRDHYKVYLAQIENDIAELPEEFDYPLCFESILDGFIAEFTGLGTGEVIKAGGTEIFKVGQVYLGFVPHTDVSAWKPIAFNKERGLYDKQLVWCSDDNMNGLPYLAFYNAIKDSAFSIFGHREGFNWGNMTPAYVDEPWVKIAYDKLKD